MASIKIDNLQPAGTDFFNDSESFINELTDSELSTTNGGFTPFLIGFGVGIVIGLILK